MTPLCTAVKGGRGDRVEVLLQRGARDDLDAPVAQAADRLRCLDERAAALAKLAALAGICRHTASDAALGARVRDAFLGANAFGHFWGRDL